MSGHSKWSQIKHQKGQTDARRGQLFTKLAREITVAARKGGPDPDMNPSLRLAVERARQSNMPISNIKRAIDRAVGNTGDGGSSLEEVGYEGYGPGGAAILVVALTDNRNRAASEVRKAFVSHNSKLGEVGSVAWIFEQKGVITLEEDAERAEEIALEAIDLGAEDFTLEDSSLELRVPPEAFETLRRGLEERGHTPAQAEVTLLPKTLTPLDERAAEQTLRLLDRLEELDDVQRVYTNGDFPMAVLERYRAAA
jgi:YebC/PmpR family DNA-binding regulatory protein